jgi:hypothetical protein
MVIASLCRAVGEQRLAVVAAEQEGEPVQILAQLAEVVCGITDVVLQGGVQTAGVRTNREQAVVRPNPEGMGRRALVRPSDRYRISG